jgi:hypothetical protein
MVDWIQEVIEKVEEGAWVWIREEQESHVIRYELGGILHIVRNYIVYFPVFPEGPQDFHDCLASDFSRVDQYSIRFKDQWSREITIMSFEPFERESISRFKKWEKFMDRSSVVEELEDIISVRRANPREFLKGYWYEE